MKSPIMPNTIMHPTFSVCKKHPSPFGVGTFFRVGTAFIGRPHSGQATALLEISFPQSGHLISGMLYHSHVWYDFLSGLRPAVALSQRCDSSPCTQSYLSLPPGTPAGSPSHAGGVRWPVAFQRLSAFRLWTWASRRKKYDKIKDT